MTALTKLQLKQLWKAYFQPTSADFSNMIDSWADYNYTATGTSAVARPVISKLGDIVSVKDFGAVGDGVTDDTDAIQAAIGSNRTVFFPDGIYIVSKNISFTGVNNFALVGESKNSSIIKFSQSAIFSPDIFKFLSCSKFLIKELQFDWNGNQSSELVDRTIFRIQTSNNFEISDCIILHNCRPVGLYIESSNIFYIERNYIKRFSQNSFVNMNINVSSNISPSTIGFIRNNYLENSSIFAMGTDISIVDNYILGTKYGAAIATFAQNVGFSGSFFGRYTITGNHCINANGTDDDGFLCCGIEAAGAYSIISNNVCRDNHGEGIRTFAWQSIVSNNICFNNGKGLGSDKTRCGILACYADASDTGGNTTYSCNYSLIYGNQCFDTGGGSQLYGYAEDRIEITGVKVYGNYFELNATGPLFLKATVGNSYDLDYWFNYTPVISATSGSLTTGACVGQYMRKGKFVFFQAECVIANNGTASGALTVTIPIAASAGALTAIVNGKGLSSGKILSGQIGPTATTVTLLAYDATYPGSTGETIFVSGWYRVV